MRNILSDVGLVRCCGSRCPRVCSRPGLPLCHRVMHWMPKYFSISSGIREQGGQEGPCAGAHESVPHLIAPFCVSPPDLDPRFVSDRTAGLRSSVPSSSAWNCHTAPSADATVTTQVRRAGQASVPQSPSCSCCMRRRRPPPTPREASARCSVQSQTWIGVLDLLRHLSPKGNGFNGLLIYASHATCWQSSGPQCEAARRRGRHHPRKRTRRRRSRFPPRKMMIRRRFQCA